MCFVKRCVACCVALRVVRCVFRATREERAACAVVVCGRVRVACVLRVFCFAREQTLFSFPSTFFSLLSCPLAVRLLLFSFPLASRYLHVPGVSLTPLFCVCWVRCAGCLLRYALCCVWSCALCCARCCVLSCLMRGVFSAGCE